MAIQIANLAVKIQIDDKDGRKKTEDFKKRLKKLVKWSKAQMKMMAGGLGLTALAFRGWRLAGESIELATTQIQAMARVKGVLKATGHAAGFSAEQLGDMANEMQSASTIGDEEILNAMGKLATFKNVQGEVFRDATQASLDLAHTGFGSIEQASIQMGKALEDPIQGVSALKRVGVSILPDDKERIQLLMEQGNLLGAQEILLAAVKGQVDGVAQAMADTPAGQLQIVNNKLNDTKEALGTALIPMFVKVKEKWLDFLTNFILPWVKMLGFIIENWDLTWELIVAGAKYQFFRLENAVINFWKNIPQYALFGAKVIGNHMKNMAVMWLRIIKHLANAIFEVFSGLTDMIWKAITGGDVSAAWNQMISNVAIEAENAFSAVSASMQGSAKYAADEYAKLQNTLSKDETSDLRRSRREFNKLKEQFTGRFIDSQKPAEQKAIPLPPAPALQVKQDSKSGFSYGSTDLLGLASSIQDMMFGEDTDQKQLNALEAGNAMQQRQLDIQEEQHRKGGPGSLK
tara:strand:+ start:5494 stop:7044 length:1551 start_codon:yes stop_codon:yes gene_type:complete